MTQTSEICVTDLLSNLACELEQLAQMATHFDEAIGDLCAQSGANTRINPKMLQNVDLFRQRMECVARLSQNLVGQNMSPAMLDSGALGQGVYLEAVRKTCLEGKRHRAS